MLTLRVPRARRFTKFASREVVGGTVYEKFAHFDQLIQKEHFRTTYKRLKEKYAHWVSVFSDDKDNPIKCVSVTSVSGLTTLPCCQPLTLAL